MRIQKHPILQFDTGREVRFTFDGRELTGREGEPVAASLLANGISVMRRTEKGHEPRGVFCGIGQCCECMVVVDGKPNIRSCITPLREGMRVESQSGFGRIGTELAGDVPPSDPEAEP